MKTFIKNIIIFSIFQILHFNIAVSEQIGIGIQQEELIIEKSGEYYLLFCDDGYRSSFFGFINNPEIFILNNRFELINALNIFDSQSMPDYYVYDFKNVRLINDDLYYLVSKETNSVTSNFIIKKNILNNTFEEFKLPDEFRAHNNHSELNYNQLIYFDEKYVVFVDNNKEIIIEEYQTKNIIKKINDNELRAIHYENGFVYYIKNNSIISYNIKSDSKRVLKKFDKKIETYNSFIANENYVAVTFEDTGYFTEFIDLKNNKKAVSLKLFFPPEYMKIVNDKLYYNMFIINQNYVLYLETNSTTSLGYKVFSVGQDTLIDLSNNSINLIDKNGNNLKRYLTRQINDSPINFKLNDNKLSFIKFNEFGKFYKGGLECIDLTNNQRVIDDVKNINHYRLDNNFLYYLKENELIKVNLENNEEVKIFSKELQSFNSIEAFDYDENYFYLVANQGNFYILNRVTNLIDSSFSELSNKYIKKIESYRNKLLIFFSNEIDGVLLDLAYLDKSEMKFGKILTKEFDEKLYSIDISKVYTYDEVNDKLFFISRIRHRTNSLYVTDFETIEKINLDFNFTENINSIQMYEKNLLVSSLDNAYLIDVNDYSVIKSEKYEIETLRNVVDYFEGHKNTIQNIVANDDYVIIVDKLYNIFKYDTKKLSVLIENFKDTDCEDSIEVGYFDINGKEISNQAINNKLLIVKYKCLENNKFFYKLEFRE